MSEIEIEGDFLAVVAKAPKVGIVDDPLVGPALNPFLRIRKLTWEENVTLLNSESRRGMTEST
jgi:hypothetical protein